MTTTDATQWVAVIGAGPAGIFAARQLAANGKEVVLLNKDIKPGGLAEYGIYPDKHTMKEGLRKQFWPVIDNPHIHYLGMVTVGYQGSISLDELRTMGFSAILVTAGAQGTKHIGIPGEDLPGVYHAKEIVYHYNRLPPFGQQTYRFGETCAIIGAGNVMVDVARFLLREAGVQRVISVVRRGPGEVNFAKDEMRAIVAYLDMPQFGNEFARCLPALASIGQDPELGRQKILASYAKAEPKSGSGSFSFRFLSSPAALRGTVAGVTALEVSDNNLELRHGQPAAVAAGTTQSIPVDSVVFAIGDAVDAGLGLPVHHQEFVKNPNPSFPIDGVSFEAFDTNAGSVIPGVFVGGWSRKASDGLVGLARKDGTNAAKAVLAYLSQSGPSAFNLEKLIKRLKESDCEPITAAQLQTLRDRERVEAMARGLAEFKFASNDEMLAIIR